MGIWRSLPAAADLTEKNLMDIVCEKAFQKERGKTIYCNIYGGPCAHLYYCQLDGRYKQNRSAENCPGRYEKNEK